MDLCRLQHVLDRLKPATRFQAVVALVHAIVMQKKCLVASDADGIGITPGWDASPALSSLLYIATNTIPALSVTLHEADGTVRLSIASQENPQICVNATFLLDELVPPDAPLHSALQTFTMASHNVLRRISHAIYCVNDWLLSYRMETLQITPPEPAYAVPIGGGLRLGHCWINTLPYDHFHQMGFMFT